MSDKIIWFEHMYQPAWNFHSYGSWQPKRMIRQCYKPNVDYLLSADKKIKINLNITQTMFDFFRFNNSLSILRKYKELSDKGRVEIVGSSAHHILMLKKYETVLRREVLQQEWFLNYFFEKKPKVFFPPEMAVDESTIPLLKGLGYEGILVSGGEPNFRSYDCTGVFESNGMRVLAHNNLLSSQFSFPSKDDIGLVLRKLETYDEPAVFAFDHESFGGYNNQHVFELKKKFFSEALERGYRFLTVSEAIKRKPLGLVDIKPTTWVGNFSKWDQMQDRWNIIDKALREINDANDEFVRKYVLPSCHLHVDYATNWFWEYSKKAGLTG